MSVFAGTRDNFPFAAGRTSPSCERAGTAVNNSTPQTTAALANFKIGLVLLPYDIRILPYPQMSWIDLSSEDVSFRIWYLLSLPNDEHRKGYN